jgi:hypothetical protein
MCSCGTFHTSTSIGERRLKATNVREPHFPQAYISTGEE